MRTDFLENFETGLQEVLLRLCTSYNMLNGTLLCAEDIDKQWYEFVPEYMVDAVPQISDYPMASVAWAAYLGLAVAYGWDGDWETCSKAAYQSYYGEQGYDDMDDHIVRDILGLPLDGYEARDLGNIIRRCAEATITFIRHAQIEPQSSTAFHVFARACKVMYRIGAAIELKRLGYKFEKVELPN